MEAQPPMIKKLSIEVEKGKYTNYLFDDEKVYRFENLPSEAQIEILNAVLILYNLRLIPEDVFQDRYLDLVEEYSFFLNMSKDLAGVLPKKIKKRSKKSKK